MYSCCIVVQLSVVFSHSRVSCPSILECHAHPFHKSCPVVIFLNLDTLVYETKFITHYITYSHSNVYFFKSETLNNFKMVTWKEIHVINP